MKHTATITGMFTSLGGARKMEDNPIQSQPIALRDCARCQAKARTGRACRSPAVKGKRVCRMHGGTPALPASVDDGIARLKRMPCPAGLNASLWQDAARDAVRLVADGWALSALSLGWSTLDLFGAMANPAGDPYGDGLAVRLAGRRVKAICASFATVDDGNAGRSYIYRPDNQNARLLWALGRGR